MAKSIDALLMPPQWRGYISIEAAMPEIRRVYGPALGIELTDTDSKLHMRHDIGTGRVYITTDAEEFPRFAKNHPKHPLVDRFLWSVQPDGVKVGILTSQARADKAAALAPPPEPWQPPAAPAVAAEATTDVKATGGEES